MIVVIPFNVPWIWSTDYLNQTAIELGKKGHTVVCYLFGDTYFLKDLFTSKKYFGLFKKYSKNVYIVNPLYLIPFRRIKLILSLNESLNIFYLKLVSEILSIVQRQKKKIFWIFDPNLYYMYSFFRKNYDLLYDCVDFFAVGDKKAIFNTNKNEKALCKNAVLVVANSTVLKNHLEAYRKDILLVPQGFREEGFEIVKSKYIDLKLNKPVVGFVGGINNRLDISILLPLIKNNPKCNFVIWGPIQKDLPNRSDRFNKINEILNLPNVVTGSSSDKEEIPGLVSQFDVAMIPYDISQNFNRYCYPMKLFEYFYLGKPVITTDILELRRFPGLVRIGTNYSEWQAALDEILTKKWPKKNIKAELKHAKDNSWENKIKAILNNI